MHHLPRMALATPASGPDPSPAGLAWLAGLQGVWRVQHFRARACPLGTEVIGQFTGLPGRHLDAWLMPEDVLRRLFLRGSTHAEFSLVEGTLEPSPRPPVMGSFCMGPGELRPIAETLDLPVVAVLPCPPRESFHLPYVPEGVDAIFLDGLERPEDFEFFRRALELTARKPVVGALEVLPEVRAALQDAPRDRPVAFETFQALRQSFLRFADMAAIRNLSRRRPIVWSVPEAPPCPGPQFRVAYAQDDAFGPYFPDTLEALEALGADLVEFSPLHHERLPEGVDLVMIGCGYSDQYADALAENLSMIASLRSHVCRGQRIYSEGGGTAYLGRSMLIEGRRVAGAGILPFDAELQTEIRPPLPVTRTLTRDCWLGPKGTTVQGYLSPRWRLRPGAVPLACPNCYGGLTAEGDAYYHHHAVGGLVHLHLGALADVVKAFAGPHAASLARPSAHH
ncbi:MAG: cobyrinic acid a,c-diamide synthase [Isosphaeraceae bacterium]